MLATAQGWAAGIIKIMSVSLKDVERKNPKTTIIFRALLVKIFPSHLKYLGEGFNLLAASLVMLGMQ